MKIRLYRERFPCQKVSGINRKNGGKLNLYVVKGHFVVKFHLAMLKYMFHCSFSQSQYEENKRDTKDIFSKGL